jgi:DNA-binding CsgD family transcriptional regulator
VKSDAIAIVEAAYDLEGDQPAWLERLLDRVAPLLDRGLGMAAALFDARSVTIDESTVAVRGIDPRVLSALLRLGRVRHETVRRHLPGQRPLVTATQALGLTVHEARSFDVHVENLHPLGVSDSLCAFALNPGGDGVVLFAPMGDLRRPARSESVTWARVLAHVAAGERIRRGIGGGRAADWTEGAEAILSPSGSMKHAEPPATSAGAREALRDAALAIDRARSKARRNESEALDLWRGLVSGRWSLVERFDTDGRRFLVARRNDPAVSDPRGLSLRERQVLAYTAMGHSMKLIAYTLGLSPSAVAGCRARAMRKLGIRTQTEFLQLFSGGAAEADKPRSSKK